MVLRGFKHPDEFKGLRIRQWFSGRQGKKTKSGGGRRVVAAMKSVIFHEHGLREKGAAPSINGQKSRGEIFRKGMRRSADYSRVEKSATAVNCRHSQGEEPSLNRDPSLGALSVGEGFGENKWGGLKGNLEAHS